MKSHLPVPAFVIALTVFAGSSPSHARVAEAGLRVIAPDSVAASDDAFEDRVEIRWNGDTADILEMRVERDGVLLSLAPSEANVFSDRSGDPGVTYEYCVVVRRISDSGDDGPVCDTGRRILFAASAVSGSDGTADDGVHVSWRDRSQVESAYRIYRDGVFLVELAADAVSYMDAGAGVDTEYEYCIAAADENGFESAQACDSGRRGFILPPSGVAASDGRFTDRVKVSWTDQTENESGYEVARDGIAIATLAAGSEAFTDEAPEIGTTHAYCITTLGDGGVRSVEICDDGIAGPGTLAPPENATATMDAFDDRVEFTWEDAADTEDGFRVFRDPAGGSEAVTEIAVLDPGTTSYRDDSADADVMYTYCVAAFTDEGGTSVPVCADGGLAAVLAPTDVAATDGDLEDRVRISWSSTSATAGLFKLYRDGRAIRTVPITQTSYSDFEIASDVTYSYCVTALTPQGIESSSTCDDGSRSIASPISVAATYDEFEDRVEVSWVDESMVEDGYVIYRQAAGDAVPAVVDSVSATRASIGDYEGAPGVEYTYSVRAYDDRGASDAGEAKGRRTLKNPSEFIAEDGVSEDRVRLTWKDNSRAETGYEISRDGVLIATTSASASSYTDAAVVIGAVHTYEIRAVDLRGSSAKASDVGSTAILAPESVNASDSYADRITVVWVDVSAVESGYRLTRRKGAEAVGLDIDLPAGSVAYQESAGLDEGVNYTYCVTAFSEGPSGRLYSAERCGIGRILPPGEAPPQPASAQKIVSPGGGNGLFGFSMAVDDSVAMVGQPGVNSTENLHEVRFYKLGADGLWTEDGSGRASPTAYRRYGHDVDLSEDYAAIGAPGYDNDQLGAVLIYQRKADGWGKIQEFYGQNFDINGDSLGVAVAVSDRFVVAGGPWSDGGTNGDQITGGAFAYGIDCFGVGYKGVRLHTVTSVDLSGGDRFGAAADMLGVHAIIGAPGDDGKRGAAFIFERTGGCNSPGWKVVAKDLLPFTLRKAGAAFGAAVALSDDFALVGAPFEDGDGAVHVFRRQDAWARHSMLIPNTPVAGANFGASVAILGDYALVGAPGENGGRGAVYAFEFDAGRNAWIQTARYDASVYVPGAEGDDFGHAVAVGPGAYLFGAPRDDEAGTDGGAFYSVPFHFEPPPPPQAPLQVPTEVHASDFLDDNRIEIKWRDNATEEEGYRIFRSDEKGVLESYATVAANVTVHNDFEALPGAAYEYCVAAYKGEFSESDRVCDIGRRPVNGHLSGRIATPLGADIDGAEVCLSPSPNKALIFDGTGGYARARHDGGRLDAGITIEAWVKTNSSGASYILSQDGCGLDCVPGAAPDAVLLGLDASGSPFLTIRDQAGVTETVTASATVKDGRWHHIAAVRASQDALRIYIDGSLSASAPSTSGAVGSADAEPDPAVIGARLVAGASVPEAFFSGQIDDVRIWATSRSEAEIALSMNTALTGEEAGLTGYWPLNQGARTVAADLAPTAAHGTLSGGVYWTSDSAPLGTCAPTDAEGNYTLTDIGYGASSKFTVTPSLGARQFDPAFKTITLSTGNPVQNQVDFIDVSAFTVSGRIEFAGTDCPVPDAEILIDEILKGRSERDGTFAVASEIGVDLIIEPRLGSAGDEHSFTPSSDTITVQKDVSGLFFADAKTRTLSGFFGGSCNKNIGTATLKLFTENGCFTKEVPLSGSYSVDLPPQRYLAQVVDVQPTDPNLRADIIAFFDGLGTQEIDLTAGEDTLDIIYHAPLKVAIEGLPSPSASCPSFTSDEGREIPAVPVLSEGIRVPLIIRVDEDYGSAGLCPVKEGSITLFDGIADRGGPVQADIKDGVGSYESTAGAPNVSEGARVDGVDRSFQKALSVVARVQGRDPVTETEWVVVEGTRERTASFVSATTEEFPILILRDPPGSSSYAYIEEGTTVCNRISHVKLIGGGGGIDLDFPLGLKIEFGPPPASIETGIGWVIRTRTVAGVDVTSLNNGRDNLEICATTTERFSTPSDNTWVGEDLFVGVALNLIFAKTDELDVDGGRCALDLSETVELGLDGNDPFETTYVYGRSHIQNSLIPDLDDLIQLEQGDVEVGGEILGEDVAVTLRQTRDNWQGHLDLNDSLKVDALKNPEKNRSFSAGADYEFSEIIDSTKTLYARTRRIYFDSNNTVGLLLTGGGYDQVYGIVAEFRTEFVRDTLSTEKPSRNVGYVLSDGDTGDFFSVNSGPDPHYGTPVFGIKSGRSSNPWEPGTQKRDLPRIDVQPPVLHNVPPDELAVFTLALTNDSESQERRPYVLAAPGNGNPDNAVLSVTGDILGGARLETFLIDPGKTVNVNLSVGRGPTAYSYDSLAVILYPEEELNIWKADPRQPFPLSDTAYFSVSFDAPCSEISILRPLENWRLNAATIDANLDVILHEFNLSPSEGKEVQRLGLEYRAAEETTWLPATTVLGESLADGTTSWSSKWRPSSDGAFEVRAFTECSSGAKVYTDAVPGLVDTKPPLVYGMEPADEELDLGDPIEITFTEALDCESVETDLTRPELTAWFVTQDETQLSAAAVCDGASLRTNLADAALWPGLEGSRLTAVVEGVTDRAGNPMATASEWSFLVSRSKIRFARDRIETGAEEGGNVLVDAVLMNGHASDVAYSLAADELPAWLRFVTPAGELLPLGGVFEDEVAAGASDTLLFETADDFRSYAIDGALEGTVPVRWGSGTIPLEIVISLECPRPAWADGEPFDRRFGNTMPLIIDLATADGRPAENGDVLSAWVGRELRGTASWSTGGRYFMTVGSDAATSAEFVTFQVYDESECRALESTTAQAAFGDLAEGAFAAVPFDAAYRPDPAAPLRLGGSTTPVQVTELNAGWTFVSTNRVVGEQTVSDVFATVVPERGDLVKSRSAFAQWGDGFGWVGALERLEPGAAYMARLRRPGALYLLGEPADPLATPVPAADGWNWVGYIPEIPLAVNDALANLNGVLADGDLIKSQYAFAVYSGAEWIGSLTLMQPGLGYALYLQDAGGRTSFTFPADAVLPAAQAIATNDGAEAVGSSAGAHTGYGAGKAAALAAATGPSSSADVTATAAGAFDVHRFSESMTVVARLDAGLAAAVDSIAVLAAFAVDGTKEELRGVARAVVDRRDPTAAPLLFLMVHGREDETSPLVYRLYDEAGGVVIPVGGAPDAFATHLAAGTVQEPVVMSEALAAVEIPEEFALAPNYPNPFNPQTTIVYALPEPAAVRLVVFDLLGRRVAVLIDGEQPAGRHEIVFDARALASGAYFYRLEAKGEARSFSKVRQMILLQ